ncbi:IS21 family transposase [Bradyrhizobium sp. CCBAU 45384]|uniref:IS21 family transposase n=1 Tax=Bradyrhizobium sp. CCBAU 45384 TaxID=858428 RepID=UPI0023067FBE|nr:IS21 family transposase [Bradyrhizobium sp. CCBAU 45384]MDA9406052.1 integrase [Bradyrhizobium sp. CCBAU 45384]
MLKLGELVMILDLHRQGLSVSAIARQLGVDRKTVRAYIAKGLEPPVYKKRAARPGIVDHFEAYLRERLAAYPALTAVRLWRELKERGFVGGYSTVRDRVRELRPAQPATFEVRFETPAGEQAQVDFARFEVEFIDEPAVKRIVWLFSMVLGYSRLTWARFVVHQDLQTVLRCHIAALEAIGGAPREILYDRMKTAVLGEDAEGLVVYNRALVDLARHYGFQPRACRPYRPKTKGKVERPFRYIREDFFLGGVFRNLDDLNGQLRHWLDTVANPRVHATTHRVVNEAFAEEKAALQALPSAPYRAVLHLERRASHEGMVSVGGNLYSVPDTTRRRVFDVHVLADEIRIFEGSVLVASHAPLEGRGQKRLDPAHRKLASFGRRRPASAEPVTLTRAGDHAVRRSLDFYAAVGRRLASQEIV